MLRIFEEIEMKARIFVFIIGLISFSNDAFTMSKRSCSQKATVKISQERSKIEKMLVSLLNKNFDERAVEKNQYSLSLELAKTLTKVTSVDELILGGYISIDSTGNLHSDFIMSSALLGSLTVKSALGDTFQILDSRGTTYFTDPDVDSKSPKPLSTILEGKLRFTPSFKSTEAKRISESGELNVLILIPKEEAAEVIGGGRVSTGTYISSKDLRQMRGVRILATPRLR